MSTSPPAPPSRCSSPTGCPTSPGGLVISDIEQRTGWDYDYNKRLAQTAENNGFDYALTQVRYTASYGAAYQHEATSASASRSLLATERLKVISAVHPYMWHPGVLAKFIATADHLSNGRAAINVVSGWFKDEADQHGRAAGSSTASATGWPRSSSPTSARSGPATAPSSVATSSSCTTST